VDDFVLDVEIADPDGRPLVIIDTKWKRLFDRRGVLRVQSDDLQQMIAYGAIRGVRSLALVYPVLAGEGVTFESPCFAIAGEGGTSLRVYALPLLTDGIDEAARGLVDRLIDDANSTSSAAA
jgi:5-methylcytosine-specific restriction endonuclease McrBC regulatory subunit McrC